MDNKIYWVDRFDHVLSEEEVEEVEFMGFDDAEYLASGNEVPELFDRYVSIENKLIDL